MLTRPLFSLFASLSLLQTALAVTQIALFSDSNCQNSLRGVEGPNGYPNGTCTDFRRTGSYGSFHVVGMDPGCTVTIYADDYSGDICSSTAPQLEINLVDCYNSSYIYYSIDWCNSPRSATPSPSSSTSSSAKVSTGAIVGGVVGGVVVLGILIGVGVYMWKRKIRNNDAPQEVGGTGIAELSYEPKPMEMDGASGMMAYKRNAEVQVQVQREPIEIGDGEVGREYGYQYEDGSGYGPGMGMEQEGLSGAYGTERNTRYYRR
ncbi:hypothetical protein FB567DRAFT_54884 [Paraphoma chrysanthemicola]|uniref:Uncharacterized protein n=1 Tax=Paraphoma chrysanthemicola TaxID=798071 RepID=A0A8K0R4N4_9PLEO|nr:hypothetical protein FB567DRAFT_54884 [Paraphoma chrysanthemicola]